MSRGQVEEVLGCKESPEKVLIKCSTKGNNWVAVLMLYLVLGKDHRRTHDRNHARRHVVTGLLLTEQQVPEYNIWLLGILLVLCLICLKLISKHYFACFKKQNTKAKEPKTNKKISLLRGKRN